MQLNKRKTVIHSHNICIQLDLVMNQFAHKMFSTASSLVDTKERQQSV